MEQQSLSDNTSFYNMVSEYFKPITESYYSEKNSFQNISAQNIAPGYSRALMEKYNKINIVSMPASTISVL